CAREGGLTGAWFAYW
nr:immunoglobulin heavy chain junction region [Mus musculus]